jgi:hypothetical protein
MNGCFCYSVASAAVIVRKKPYTTPLLVRVRQVRLWSTFLRFLKLSSISRSTRGAVQFGTLQAVIWGRAKCVCAEHCICRVKGVGRGKQRSYVLLYNVV